MKRYYLIEVDSWSDITKIKEYKTKREVITAMENRYVATILDNDSYCDEETFISDHYAQWSNGYRTIEYRIAELESPPIDK